MKKSAWYVIIIMIVLIAAIAVSVSSMFNGGDNKPGDDQLSNNPTNSNPPVDGSAPASPGLDIILPGTAASPTPGVSTQQPQQGQNNNGGNNNNTQPQAPVNTPAPPAPTPTPVPTPPPAPTPTPMQTVSGSGTFNSNTGTGLNIKVDWKAYNAADGSVMLQIDVSASHYSFYTSALWDAIWVKVGGVSYSTSSPDISYDGDELTYSHMATFHVPASTGNVNIDVVWYYNGSYSGKDLKEITASGSAWIS